MPRCFFVLMMEISTSAYYSVLNKIYILKSLINFWKSFMKNEVEEKPVVNFIFQIKDIEIHIK